jgi:hypothetical protein
MNCQSGVLQHIPVASGYLAQAVKQRIGRVSAMQSTSAAHGFVQYIPLVPMHWPPSTCEGPHTSSMPAPLD